MPVPVRYADPIIRKHRKDLALFKGLAQLGSLLRQAQQIGGKFSDLQAQLKSQKAIGTAGGGMVEVEVNGLGEVLRLQLDPTLIDRREIEMIEDLVPAAVNQALQKARQLNANAFKSLTDGLDIPGLGEAIARFTDAAPAQADPEDDGQTNIRTT